MRSIAVVTTCNERGYLDYGRMMMASFDEFVPTDIPLHIYYEGFFPDLASNRFIKRDLNASCPDLVAFKQRNKDNPRAHGHIRPKHIIKIHWSKPRIKVRRVEDDQAFRWDAVRFSHKVFAFCHAAAVCKTDMLFWMDADIILRSKINNILFYDSLPDNCLVSFLKRHQHSECSFIGFNLRHPQISRFLDTLREYYTTDSLFKEREYHDSYLFDIARRRFERAGCLTHDIAQGVGLDSRPGHVFENSVLGAYMEHLKGRRKALIAPITAVPQVEG